MGKIAFIYPGQGAQKCFMGQDFYNMYPKCAEVFDKAEEALDVSVKDLVFRENPLLDQTQYTQPAMVTTCLGITAVLNDMGIYPDMTAGLSLGEYAAIAAAGGMDYVDAIRLVRQRGVFMEEAVPAGKGAMTAVLGMEAEAIEKVLAEFEDVYIANYNCPGQIVITGMKEGVEAASVKLTEAGAKRCIPLVVSGPFHSIYLKEAGAKLREYMADVTFNELQIPYITNVTATYVSDKDEIAPLLEKQVCSSVRWQQSVEIMISDGVDTFIEIGPGKTLAGFIKKIDRDVKVINVSCVEDLENVKELIG
ncbi:MAG: ACP S-malonyltransferase [Lachnospiraceae bacterium]|nr:ACP S-malonyltransferase [Lachnospiraceae bacterium]